MSKTWETLFNLSSFMNYLLTKALPDEKLEAPLYVLDSLYDLLTVTSAWIDKIKSLSNDRPSLRNQISEHSAQAILSSRSNKNIEENTSQTNIRHNYSSECPSDSAPVPSCYSSKEGVRDNGVEGLESSSKDVSEVFMRLSKEMINGRPYGHYCRPCDSVIFSKKEWDIHMVDRLHTFLTEECEIKFACCAYCKLIIFASPRDANKLFKYHELEHHPQYHINMPTKENTSKNETNKNPLKSRDDFVRNDSDVVSSRVSDIEVDHGFRTGQRISPFFIELDKKMHSGKEKGFYCYSCDKAFEVVTEWNHHFQETAVHSDQFDSSASFDMCDSCSLVIYAIPSILKWYKSHHMLGHYCHGGEKKHNIKSSVESLQSSVQGQDNPKSCKSTDSYQNTYKISQQFKDFNTKIHSYNLEGHYYCRPCNAALGPEEWIKHSQSRKHSELMASRKFKNWKGTCTYCSLTIIGTRDTVKYYMEFHSVLHNKIISYDFHKISSYSTPDNFTPTHPKRKQKERIRKTMVSRGSVSTLGDEGVSDFEEKDIDDSKTENSSNISDSVGESSWYASSREEQILNSIRQLIESRTKEKYTSGIPQFGALCTLCEYSTEDAFDWQDHMTSGEHCQRKTSHDKQAFFSDLNIYIFASMNLFEKYKSLVKGNWSFIEN